MVRFWGLLALGLCLFTQSLTAKEKAGEWILTIDTPRNWAGVAKSLRGRAKFVRLLGRSHRYALFLAPVAAAQELSQLSHHIRTVQPNFIYSSFSSADPDWEESWGLINTGQSISNFGPGTQGIDIQAEEAWKITRGSKAIKVAILDTGVDFQHEDLRNNIAINTAEIPGNGLDDDGNGWVDDIHGWNFVEHHADPQDDNGHGSFCSAIIGSDWDNGKGSKGINQEVSLLPVKILDFLGQGSTASAIDGIEYAVDNGAHILNLSWGGNRFDPALFEVIKEAVKKGALLVAAAGNSAQNNDLSSEAIYPASFDVSGLISVAAYDPKGNRASFSNVGSQKVHLGAPGVAVFGAQLGGYGFRSGTSFAAPHVTGVGALLKSVFTEWTPQQLQERILKSAQPLHPYEKYFTQTGALVHAGNALRGIFPEKPPVPIRWKRVPFLWATSHPYLPQSQYRVVIKEPGAARIRIHFKMFHTETNYDPVELTDRTGKRVQLYSGEKGVFMSHEALGEEMILQFHTDYNRQFHGIDIDYYEAAFE